MRGSALQVLLILATLAYYNVLCDLCLDGSGASGLDGVSFCLNACCVCMAGYYSNSYTQHVCMICPAGTTTTLPLNNCEDCPNGQYSDKAGLTACDPCADGMYNTGTGNTDCQTCSVGYYSNSDTYHVCEPCSNGYYGNQQGLGSCLACPTGTFNSGEGNTYCTCPAGSYFAAASGACIPCSDGYTSGTSTTSSPLMDCTACSAGQYSDTSTGHICTYCPNGYYSASSAQRECTKCPSGTSNVGTGNKFCTCPAGWYFTDAGICDACADGLTSAESTTANTVTGCNTCSVGSTSSSSTGHLCVPCSSANTYNDVTTGQEKCYDCPAGSWNYAGGAECNCNAGYHFDSTGNCVACAAGFTSTASTTAIKINTCDSCSTANTYNDAATGQALCYPCPGNSWNSAGGISCTCDAGHYFNSDGSCVVCPDGTTADASSTADKVTTYTSCAVGYESNAGTGHLCKICADGKYNNASLGQGACVDCPAGSYNSGTGNTMCICDSGKYFDSAGDCVDCPSGSSSVTSTTSSHSSCVTCGSDQTFYLALGICVYTTDCSSLCSGNCIAQLDYASCIGGCKESAVSTEVSTGIFSCACPSGTMYFNGSCSTILYSGCYSLCGSGGCLRVGENGFCLDCSTATNVVSGAGNGSALYECECGAGSGLITSNVCGYTEGCHEYCGDGMCVALNDSSACLSCADGLSQLSVSGINVTCGCPSGTVYYYGNHTCMTAVNDSSSDSAESAGAKCYVLCGSAGCLSPNNSTMCLLSCKITANVITTVLHGEVVSCDCAVGTKLNTNGECVLDVECDPLCTKCSDADTCIECPDKEGMELRDGKCVCSAGDGYVLSGDGCVTKKVSAVATASYAAYEVIKKQ